MDVVGIGKPCLDLIVRVNEMPVRNRHTRLLEQSWQGGGKVSTALVALARLGAKAGIVGLIGNGPYGRFCLNDFKRHGIDVSRTVIDMEGENPFTVSISEDITSTRNLICTGGSLRELMPDELDRDYITSAKYLHLEMPRPAAVKAALWAREAGVKVCIDAEKFIPEMKEMMPLINVFIASEFCYREMFENDDYEDNCRKVMNMGPEIVVFTFGSRGCIGMSKEGYFQIPCFNVEVKDTTGAGDVFHGAFIYGLLQNWSVKETARFASAVSAIKCTRIGGRAGIPDLKTVKTFMESGVIDYSEIDERVLYYSKCPVIASGLQMDNK